MTEIIQGFERAEKEGWSEWIKTRADEEAVAQGYYFDLAAGLHVVDFIETFCFQTKNIEVPAPVKLATFQRDEIIIPLFSWKAPDGTRRFRQAYIEIPKKNGKSFLCSSLILYLLMADGVNRAQVYSIAYDKRNAKSVFDECKVQAEANPELAELLTVTPSKQLIDYANTASFYQVLSADQSGRNEGFDISGLVVDELHTLKKRDLFEALRYGGRTRSNPLSVYITTAGADKNTICYELHEYSQAILEGFNKDILDFFPYIRAADPDDDWTKPETWRKANPMLGITISEKAFAADCLEAQKLPNKENSFKRYSLNLWTDSETRWIGSSYWDECGKVLYTEDDLLGRECWGGIDIGISDDIFAFVLVFPWDDGTYRVLPKFWCAKENIKEKSKKNPYDKWRDDGFLTETGENATDYARIRHDILTECSKFQVQKIGIDPWQATFFGQQLAAEDLDICKFGQTFRYMTEPLRQIENLVLTNRLHHGNNPVLNWMAGNAVVSTDPTGSMRIAKPSPKSPEKVDGMVAMAIAFGVMNQPEAPVPGLKVIRG